jgi:hypothetical protein
MVAGTEAFEVFGWDLPRLPLPVNQVVNVERFLGVLADLAFEPLALEDFEALFLPEWVLEFVGVGAH